jgi:hypothetical protein
VKDFVPMEAIGSAYGAGIGAGRTAKDAKGTKWKRRDNRARTQGSSTSKQACGFHASVSYISVMLTEGPVCGCSMIGCCVIPIQSRALAVVIATAVGV